MFRKCKNLKETHKILSNEQVNEKHNNKKKKNKNNNRKTKKKLRHSNKGTLTDI